MSTKSERALHASRAPTLLILSSLLSAFACSVDRTEPRPSNEERSDGPAPGGSAFEAELVEGADSKNGYLRAVASVGGCTGVFIRTSDNPAAPAYLLTAGRCIEGGLDATYGVRFEEVVLAKGPAVFDFASKRSEPRPTAAYVDAAYVTLKGVDLALIKLDRSIGSLQAEGVEPLSLSATAPAAGAPIEMVGLALGANGAEGERVLRRVRCAEGARRPSVVEHYSYWHDLHVNECAELGAGATGGPAIDENGRVFGVFSTRFEGRGPQAPCYLNYPCEVGAGSVHGAEKTSYVVEATAFANCFDAGGNFDASLTSCSLDRGVGVAPNATPRIIAPTYGDPAVKNTWSFSLHAKTETHYRYKVGAASSVDCRDPEGYSEPLPIEDGPSSVAVPQEYGLYALCLVTGSGNVGDPSWQAFRYPHVIVKTVQSPTTPVEPEATVATPEQVFALTQQIVSAYRDVASAHGARFLPSFGPDAVPAAAIDLDRTWRLKVGWDLRAGMSADVASFIMCHEVGHVIAGFPFKPRTGQAEGISKGEYGSVISTEGNSDYFAAKECLPKVWAGQRDVNAKFRETASDYARARCDEVWSQVDEQNLCYRILAVAEPFARWSTGAGGTESPRLDEPDATVVPRTLMEYPEKKQCRVDTIVRGALCRTKFRGTGIPGLVPPFEQVASNPPFSEAAAAGDSCTEGPGARPSCWFAPDSKPFDCGEVTQDGVCGEVDGKPAVLWCDEERGQTFKICLEGDTCQVVGDYARCFTAPPTEP
jgi:hypothetical protein